MDNREYQALKAALLWHLDAGADQPFAEAPQGLIGSAPERAAPKSNDYGKNKDEDAFSPSVNPEASPDVPLGAAEARAESLKLALAAQTLEELRAAIAGFDGIGLKATATTMVFSDGNPESPLMLVGEAPGAEEDRQGKPFVGESGLLLDRILASAGLDRKAADPLKSIYISNILNWRPPGNRTPTAAEIMVSLPFIERHIQLVKPKLLIFAGGVAAQALFGSTESISRLRGRWIDYLPQTPELRDGAIPIPALAIFHPSYLLRTPAQKRLVWRDMLLLLEKRRDIEII